MNATSIDQDYVRITSILAPFSGMDKINPEVLEKASARGSKVHLACDSIIDGMGYPRDEELDGYMQSFLHWSENKELINKIPRFYCDQYKITGEVDILYKNENGFTLVDLKTSRVESKTWLLQGSAYSYLCKKDGYNITAIEFVKLDKDGKPPKIYSYQENFPLFLNCLETYNYFFKNKVENSDFEYI